MNRKIYAGITSIGSYLPKKFLTNAELIKEKGINTTDEWIKNGTGISKRYEASDRETVAYMGLEASKLALSDAGIKPSELDFIISVSASPEKPWPGISVKIAGELGINCGSFDIQSACAGFASGIDAAKDKIEAGRYEKILLVCPEKMTSLLDWNDRETCILFGDGAAALVIEKVDSPGILFSSLGSEGNLYQILELDPKITMQGNEVYRKVIYLIQKEMPKFLKKSGVKPQDIDFFIPHQANERITQVIGKLFSPEKVVSNIAHYGNTSTASIPLAIDELYRQGKLRKGNIILTAAFGAGITWGFNLIRWTKGGE